MKTSRKTQVGRFLVDTWYDRQTRSWVTQLLNEEGNQIFDAFYAGNKEDALYDHKFYIDRINSFGGDILS